jgi:surface polysaccharide O-acyltransferase-like enzyme
MKSRSGPVVTQNERALDLDVLRGAGALAVIVLHASAGPLTQESSLGQASWTLLLPNVMARFAVPVFVILSGMGLTLSARPDDGYPRFLLRRLSSILPAYIAWSLIYNWLLPKHEALSVRGLAADLYTGHASNHLYFVPAIVRLYVLYPVMRYCARSAWGVLGCCALSASMIWLSPLLPHTQLGAILDAVLPLRWIGYFVLGIWLGSTRPHDGGAATSRKSARLAPVVAVLSLGYMIATVRSELAHTADIEVALDAAEPLVFPYSVGILLWVMGEAPADGRLSRLLTFVSHHSYSVYLSHMLMLHVSVLVLQELAAESAQVTRFATGLVLAIPLALLTAVLGAWAKRGWKNLSLVGDGGALRR